MGGLIILSSIIITSVFLYSQLSENHSRAVCHGRIWHYRVLDDYIKIVMKRSEGLKPMQKLVGQFIITGIFAWYLLNSGGGGNGYADSFYGRF